MAIKIATGFEHVRLRTGNFTITWSEFVDYMNGCVKDTRYGPSTTGTYDITASAGRNIDKAGFYQNTTEQYARTRHTGYSSSPSGGYIGYFGAGHYTQIVTFDLTKFSSGLFGNIHYTATHALQGDYQILAAFSTGADHYAIALNNTVESGKAYLVIRDTKTGQETNLTQSGAPVVVLATQGVSSVNFKWGVDSTGTITAVVNSMSVTHDTGVSFDQWQEIGLGYYPGSWTWDDMIVCDGAGSEYNTIPPSIRGVFVGDAASVTSSTEFHAPSGSTVQQALLDGDDTTITTISAVPAHVEITLPAAADHVPVEYLNDLQHVVAVNTQYTNVTSTQINRQAQITVKNASDNTTNINDPVFLTGTSIDITSMTFNTQAAHWTLSELDDSQLSFRLDIS